MLPLPDLDNRRWEQIVADARKSIPKLVPEWTDENYHDPGITLLELLGWLTEMQQYHLSRITEKNERKFLKLLGTELKEASPARVDVTFSEVKEEFALLPGTKMAAGEEIFETTEKLLLIPAAIDRVIVLTVEGPADYTAANENAGVHFPAFGLKAEKGSRLFIGFDRPLPIGREITLTINLFDDYPVPVTKLPEEESALLPSARVAWQYYGGSEKESWRSLDVLEDGTYHFTCSGRITFRLPEEMVPTFIHPAQDRGRYWLCCSLEEDGFEIAPRITRISTNTLSALHRETWCAALPFDGSGLPGQVFAVENSLAWYGHLDLQVQEQDGSWRYWVQAAGLASGEGDGYIYTLTREEDSRRLLISFGDGRNGRIPPAGKANIRAIVTAPSFRLRRLLGQSNGLPGQIFRLAGLPKLLEQALILQVGKKVPGQKQMYWEDWTRVDDFSCSTSEDRHYVYDPRREEFIFGDNEKGLIPYRSEEENICIIACQTGGGAAGNVRPGTIDTLVGAEEVSGLRVTNHFYAAGGRERETLLQGKERILNELQEQKRAVTNEDYEKLALATPGLRVARVKALSLYAPGLRDYPRNTAPAQVTVVVVPYSEEEQPMPGKGFLQTVKKYLDHFRLITTEVHVIPPEYIKVTVNAVVVVEPHLKGIAADIERSMHDLLKPLDYRGSGNGWEFGRTVYRGDIYSAISRIPGVIYIEDLWLQAEGRGFSRDMGGNIHIPPYGLVYSEGHDIKTVSREEI